MFEAAFATLDAICERTRLELASYRSQRPTDDDTDFVAQLVTEFLRAGREQHDGRPGHRTMALSVYNLVILRDRVARLSTRVAELEDLLAMRDDALEIAWAKVDELENAS